jgi:hypothetical protein
MVLFKKNKKKKEGKHRKISVFVGDDWPLASP